jgi:hypothetical protein
VVKPPGYGRKIMEQMIPEKGIVLMGEAANRYITYKYFEAFLVLAIFVGLGWLLYKIFRD